MNQEVMKHALNWLDAQVDALEEIERLERELAESITSVDFWKPSQRKWHKKSSPSTPNQQSRSSKA